MAARENQGYLIAVIILVLLSLVLALVAFLGVQKAYEQADAAASTESKLKVSRLIADAEALKGEALKAVIGFGPAPSEIDAAINNLGQISSNQALSEADKKIVNDIVAEVREAKEIYDAETSGKVTPEDGDVAVATLRTRITGLTTLVGQMRNDFAVQVRTAEEAEATAKRDIEEAKKAQLKAEETQEELKKKLEAEKELARENQARLQEEVDKGKDAIVMLGKQASDAALKAAEEISVAENQAKELLADNITLKRKLSRYTNKAYDYADGQIVRVAPRLDTAFIDIGRADGLTNNRTFSVYDNSVTDFKNGTKKGDIEVVRVFEFRSEARIIDENPVDPILPGDHILTPSWDPGFTIQFALSGRFDLDGDRFDDTEKLVRLIEQNGGKVVARHDEKGNITGKITPEVRYLVEGNEALVGGQDDDPDAGKILTAIRKLNAEAEENTVQVIDLQKLLNRLGVPAQSKTKQLDFSPGGFVKRQPGEIRDSGSSTRDNESSNR